jgi:hypothetical protein
MLTERMPPDRSKKEGSPQGVWHSEMKNGALGSLAQK